MLAAIGDVAGAPSGEPQAVAAAEPKAQDAVEPRTVTVMFSGPSWFDDTRGSNGPRGLREIISAYQKRAFPPRR